jgi:hypothetical protein
MTDFSKIYMVKNLSAGDEASPNLVILPHPFNSSQLMSSLEIPSIGISAGEYKCVQTTDGFSFDGTESWVQEMLYVDYIQNQYNPIFFDLSAIPDAEIGETLESIGAGPSNEALVSSIIRETSVGPLFKSAAWTVQDKLAFNDYWHRLWEYCGLGNVGALMGMLQTDLAILSGGGTVTTIDRSGATVNVNQLTIDMLNYAMGKCIEYKKKYPDGTV